MKLARIQDNRQQIHTVEVDDSGELFQLTGDFGSGFQRTGEQVSASKFLAPIQPAAIFCIGLNYRQHANESKMAIPEFPVLFMKAPSAAVGHGQPIVLPKNAVSNSVDYECELAVVIGTECKDVSEADALKHVFGYTCCNDVSARDWQIKKGGSQWCRGKTFDTFCPLGPHVVTSDEFGDPQDKQIRTILNGDVMQDARTDDMIFSVAQLVSFLSQDTTLMPGTVIITGTPHGVGFARTPPVFLQEGDIVTIEIESIGALTNQVR